MYKQKTKQKMRSIMRSIKYTSALLFVMLLAWPVQGQDFASVLEKMYDAYEGLEDFSTDFEVRVYRVESGEMEENTSSEPVPLIVQKGSIRKHGEAIHYKLPTSELLLSGQQLIQVDHTEAAVSVSPVSSKDRKKAFSFVAPDLDRLRPSLRDVQLIAQTATTLTYRMRAPRALITEVILELDKESLLINEMTYFYNQQIFGGQQKAVVEFISPTATPDFAKDAFAATRYVRKTGNTYATAKGFERYDLVINQ